MYDIPFKRDKAASSPVGQTKEGDWPSKGPRKEDNEGANAATGRREKSKQATLGSEGKGSEGKTGLRTSFPLFLGKQCDEATKRIMIDSDDIRWWSCGLEVKANRERNRGANAWEIFGFGFSQECAPQFGQSRTRFSICLPHNVQLLSSIFKMQV